MTTRFCDTTKSFACPYCREEGHLFYAALPASQLHYTDEDGVQHVDHFGPQRDYKCRNCDHEWLQDKDAPHDT